MLSKTMMCLCLTFLAFSFPAMAQESLRMEPYYTNLDSKAAQGGSTAILNSIEQQASDLKNRLVILQWLKDRTMLKQDPDPFYSLYYSDLLFTTAQAYDRAGKIEAGDTLYPTSFLLLNVFEAMALIDAARCEDPSVMAPVQTLIAGRYAYFRDIMSRMPAGVKQQAKHLALGYEEKLARRPPFPAICNSGMKAMESALKDPNHKLNAEEAPNMVGGGKTMVTPSKPYAPNFISEDAWNRERQKIRRMIQQRE